MRTIPIVAFVLCLGVAFAIVTGAGIGAEIFGVKNQDAGTQGELDDSANETSLNESEGGGVSGSVLGDNEPTVVGFILSTGDTVTNIAAAVILLPFVLANLGFPAYFAFPVGAFAQIVVGIGVFQFITGRTWE